MPTNLIKWMAAKIMRVLVMHGWTSITAFGDSAVLMPCAAAVFVWLGLSAVTRAMAWRWLLLFGVVAVPVATSKLAFMAWGLGIASLNFTGISGHSAMSAMVWPALLALLWPRPGKGFCVVGASAGLVFAVAIAVSRVAVHAHSWAEVIAGLSLGGLAIGGFFWKFGSRWRLEIARGPAAVSLLLILAVTYGHRFPSERLLRVVAQHLSLDHAVYSRRSLHESHE